MTKLGLPSFVLICAAMVTIAVLCVEEEDWQRYLDQRYNYINHFSEMLRRKNDEYHGKRDVGLQNLYYSIRPQDFLSFSYF